MEDIRAVFRAKYREYQACYDEALWRVPNASGRVQLKFVISSEGKVGRACIQEPALRDGETLECILDEVMKLDFGRGKPATVVYPLSLEPWP